MALENNLFGEFTWKQMYFLHVITLYDEAPMIKYIADFMDHHIRIQISCM